MIATAATFVAAAVVAGWCIAAMIRFQDSAKPMFDPLKLAALAALAVALWWLLSPRLHDLAVVAALGVTLTVAMLSAVKP